jgi:hypothetical protein
MSDESRYTVTLYTSPEVVCHIAKLTTRSVFLKVVLVNVLLRRQKKFHNCLSGIMVFLFEVCHMIFWQHFRNVGVYYQDWCSTTYLNTSQIQLIRVCLLFNFCFMYTGSRTMPTCPSILCHLYCFCT